MSMDFLFREQVFCQALIRKSASFLKDNFLYNKLNLIPIEGWPCLAILLIINLVNSGSYVIDYD